MEEAQFNTFAKLLSGIKSCSSNEFDYRPAVDQLADVTDNQWLQLVIACSRKPFTTTIDTACKIIGEKIKWKNNPNGVIQLCEEWKTSPDLEALKKQDSRDQYDFWSSVSGMGRELCNKTKDLPAGKKASQAVFDLVSLLYKKRSRWLAALLEKLYELADFKDIDAKRGEEFANAQLNLYVEAKTADWFEKEENMPIAYIDNWIFAFHGTTNCMDSKPNGTLSDGSARVMQAIWKLWDWLNRKQDDDITYDSGSRNHFGNAIYQIVYRFIFRFANTKEAVHLKLFVPHCQSWIDRNPDDMNESLTQIREGCESVMTALMRNVPQIVGDSSDSMLQQFFKTKDYSTLSSISQAYETNQDTKKAVHANIAQIVKVLGHDSSLDYQILSLLHQVAKKEPFLLEKHISKIEKYITHAHHFSQALMILGLIANAKPTLFKGKGNNYCTIENTAMVTMQLFLPIAHISDSEAERMIKVTEKEIQKEIKTDGSAGMMPNSLTILSQWTIFAQTRKAPLEKHRKFITELLNNPKLKQSAQGLLDVLDGRSLETVANAVDKHEDDIEKIDGKITKNRGDINRLDKTVDEHGNQIAMNTTFTKRSMVRLDHVENRVDNAEEHIDELDNKTVSNAPVWAKEVSKLLNPRSDNDWRLVAKRIGYSNDDIRGWASQSDPCMSMLAEFYTSNKTSDATHFLVNVCKDIHRPDAAAVIEKYNKNAHNVVSDAVEVRIKPPPVFLSYQWDHQKEVKALKSSLQRQGFDCWLDIGQMGGGDSLYREIDKGIRGCRVVVLCVSKKYTQSANCQREVNLCNGLGKRMIPILLEPTDWPPAGSMGPILADKLYIEFYQKQKSKDAAEPWPTEKFRELVAQIRQIVPPDTTATSTPLKHSATAGELKQRLPEKKPKRRVSFADDLPGKGDEDSEREADTPDDLDHRSRPFFNVIISCSPDKLYEMRNLERNIAALGYTTKVMPFTENSVARVDSDVVIAALSLRYTKSSMGGKEVTKTLQSGRSLIPLLLEKITYPTPELKDQSRQVKPVDCRNMKPRADWNDTRELEEVIDRLESLVPHIKPNGAMHRDKHSSTVPPANNHVRTMMHRRLPSDSVLAREASEITIRVRPPTPEHHERNRVPPHSSDTKTLSHDSFLDESSDNASLSDDYDDGNSTDSEAQVAKSMQNDYKLPPVTAPVRAVPLPRQHHQQQPSVTSPSPRRPVQQQRSQPAAPRQPIRRAVPSPTPPTRRTYDWDNKLPSVYRQKRIASSYY